MKASKLWKVTVRTSAAGEDAAGVLLECTFGTPATTYYDFQENASEVSVYLASNPADKIFKSKLRLRLRKLAGDLGTAPAKLTVVRIAPRNWAESWKRHFKPLSIGSRLLIKPPWSKQRPRKGQIAVVLEPGLSFGTGNHPTTAYCLAELARYRVAAKGQSFLDLGTGSGILAIAAARLGYRPIQALDFDSDAVRIARTNARANGVVSIRFFKADIAALSRPARETFSIVCANLLSTLLIAHRDRILCRVAEDGKLVLAGILKAEFPRVEREYRRAGWVLQTSKIAGEWRSGTWRRK